jgi:polysaccharide export outer membrane protein
MIDTRFLIPGLVTLSLLWGIGLGAQTDIVRGYRIGYNDAIEVSVYGNPELGKQAIVPPDGIISFPLVGEASVIGMTPRQLEEELEQLYSEFLVEPVVSVSLNIFEPKNVYIIGEVHNPGALPYDSTRTLADYLIMVGGTTPEANLKTCLIIRASAPDVREEINLKKFIQEGIRYEIPLYPDDTVYIPRRSPYMLSGWAEWSQFLNIILGATTLYLLLTRDKW